MLLVGEGSMPDGMKAEANEKEIRENVIFYGASPDVPAMLSAMDAFLLPSFFEGNPLRVLRRKQTGFPVTFRIP